MAQMTDDTKALVMCIDKPCILREVVSARRSKEAHSIAFDEHERLMADGWVFLDQRFDSQNWIARYIKAST